MSRSFWSWFEAVFMFMEVQWVKDKRFRLCLLLEPIRSTSNQIYCSNLERCSVNGGGERWCRGQDNA